MKLLVNQNKIVGTALDEYEGPNETVTVPDDFDMTQIPHLTVENGELILDHVAHAVLMTQARLDVFATSRGYDGILSACTYATSTVAKFKAEGQKCVELRDATWSKLNDILDEVTAGSRPMPESYAEIVPELPALEWPA